jgi:hypothetical protein
LSLRGTSYEGRYLIADIEVEGADWPVERHVWFDPPSNPGSTVILHVQPDNVWRIDYQLRDDEDAEAALRDEAVAARLQAQLDMMACAPRGAWCGKRCTAPTASPSTATGTAGCCLPATPRTWCPSSACAG